MATQPTPWQLSADEVLAVLLRDGELYDRARYDWVVKVDHFPPGPHRDLFGAVAQLRDAGEEVHIAAVVDRCDGRVTAEWVSERMIAYSAAMRGERFRSNVEIIKSRALSYANVTSMSAGIEAIKRAESEDDRRKAVSMVITELGTELINGVQEATADAAGARFEALLETPPPPAIKTGIQWVDNNTGGMQPEQIWWIAAAYKKRKSSLMRNWIIGNLENDATVTVAVREGTQQLVIAQLVAMLAVRWLHNRGLYAVHDRNGIPLHHLSAIQLLRLRNRYKTMLHPNQVEAVTYGIDTYKSWGKRIRIYDSTVENGGLSTWASLQTVINRDRMRYGLDVCYLDYFQLFDGQQGGIYENTAYMAQQAQYEAANKHFTMVVLAQLNEESVKASGTNYSPGVKGGGDPAATADFLFRTGYPEGGDGEPQLDRLKIELKLARHSQAGIWTDEPLSPSTGLLLPMRELAL